MNTRFWGPSGWKFLHSITAIYPEKPTLTDKMLMRDFMTVVCDMLPCKYCRASFTKYSQSLDITAFLDNSNSVQEWLYKMHNKVNAKLRRQGFCTTENPSFESVRHKYIKETVIQLELIYEQIRNKKVEPKLAMERIIYFMYKIGFDFLGSIVFNYQGYFANCHTGEEKNKIVANYHKFFNMIPVIICNYVAKLSPSGKLAADAYVIEKIKIRNMLSQNEPYTKLKHWFYSLYPFLLKDKGKAEQYFGKHIVATCNNPIADKVKSCRKLTKKENKRYSRIHKKTK
jgi:hypothetical protein